jgi:hypothetical protein
MIGELEGAIKDPKVINTEAGPAIQQYFALREQADSMVDNLVSQGYIDSNIKSYKKAKVLAPLRQALRGEAQDLIDQYPAFEPFWSYVFERELKED